MMKVTTNSNELTHEPLAVTKPTTNLSGSTLNRLRLAARSLFVLRGYHETRPQDIARKAGVANGTFYLHFADKQQAFLDFAEQAQSDLLERLNDRLLSITGSRQRWEIIFGTVIDYSVDHPGLLQAAFSDPVFIAPHDESAWRIYDRLGHLVSLALPVTSASELPGESDHFAQPYDLELISHGICGLLRQALVYAGRKEINRSKLINDLSGFIDRGLNMASNETSHDQQPKGV